MAGRIAIVLGVDYRDVQRDGNRYDTGMGGMMPEMVQSVLWADTSIKELGVFGESTTPITPTTALVAGLRFDFVNASAGRANEAAAAKVGEAVAKKAKAASIEAVVFDRGGFPYHGKVKALAEAAREAGLNF